MFRWFGHIMRDDSEAAKSYENDCRKEGRKLKVR